MQILIWYILILSQHPTSHTNGPEVECDDHCCEVLAARMKDQVLPSAPICKDVRKFEPTGRAKTAQAVLAGFPCQVIVSDSVVVCIP